MSKQLLFAFASGTLALSFALAQQPSGQQNSMPGMDMSSHDPSAPASSGPSAQDKGMQNMPGMESEGGEHAMDSHHMNMGPHMKMTDLRAAKPGDAERAQKVLEAARAVMMRYRDYHSALDDGFKIFLPNVPQPMYHFTNYQYGHEAALSFNPEHPTSLLYEKHGDSYKLVGVMYTAPRRFTEEDLDERIPLSFAQWHEHVNFCRAPMGLGSEALPPNPKFGFNGSISTKEACDAAGGTFLPLVLNWMVHLYPDEKTDAEIWDAARGHAHSHAD